MGNQLAPTAPPLDACIADLPELSFSEVLGGGRFIKAFHFLSDEGHVVVKAYVKRGTKMSLEPYERVLKTIASRFDALKHPNVFPIRRIMDLHTAAYMIRQFFYSSLSDRIRTRPFLTTVEAQWLVFQMLKAVDQCHSVGVVHGDIKPQNFVLTSWNWMVLTDFAPYKPTYLPFNNPSDFSFYFDTTEKRTCYVAPERFVEPELIPKATPAPSTPSSSGSSEVGSTATTTASQAAIVGGLVRSMDIFSLGCVIAELMLDGKTLFELSHLLDYRRGSFDISDILSKITDETSRKLVASMLSLDPFKRKSAAEYLGLLGQEGSSYPLRFFEFLHSSLAHRVRSSPEETIAQLSLPNFYEEVLVHAGIASAPSASFREGANSHFPPSSSRPKPKSGHKVPEDKALGTKIVLSEGPSGGVSSTLPRTTERADSSLLSLKQLIADTESLMNLLQSSEEKEVENDSEGEGEGEGVENGSIRESDSQNQKEDESKEEEKGVQQSPSPSSSTPVTKNTPFPTFPTFSSSSSSPLLVFGTLICSLLRTCPPPSGRIRALHTLDILCHDLPEEERIARIVPYIVSELNNPAPRVRATAMKTLGSILSPIKSFYSSDAPILTEFVLPLVSPLARDPVVIVRVAFAEEIARIASAARVFLELSSESSRFFDRSLSLLRDSFASVVSDLLLDPSPHVRKALLDDIIGLCIFFGTSRTMEFLVQSLVTMASDPEWSLRLAFFQNIGGIASFVGPQAMEAFLVPCLLQAFTDDEESVIHQALRVLRTLYEVGLLGRGHGGAQRHVVSDICEKAVPLLVHPNVHIRRECIRFLSTLGDVIQAADLMCFVAPLVKPFLRNPTLLVFDEDLLGHNVIPPVSRSAFQREMSSAMDANDSGLEPGWVGLDSHGRGGSESSSSVAPAPAPLGTTSPSSSRPVSVGAENSSTGSGSTIDVEERDVTGDIAAFGALQAQLRGAEGGAEGGGGGSPTSRTSFSSSIHPPSARTVTVTVNEGSLLLTPAQLASRSLSLIRPYVARAAHMALARSMMEQSSGTDGTGTGGLDDRRSKNRRSPPIHVWTQLTVSPFSGSSESSSELRALVDVPIVKSTRIGLEDKVSRMMSPNHPSWFLSNSKTPSVGLKYILSASPTLRSEVSSVGERSMSESDLRGSLVNGVMVTSESERGRGIASVLKSEEEEKKKKAGGGGGESSGSVLWSSGSSIPPSSAPSSESFSLNTNTNEFSPSSSTMSTTPLPLSATTTPVEGESKDDGEEQEQEGISRSSLHIPIESQPQPSANLSLKYRFGDMAPRHHASLLAHSPPSSLLLDPMLFSMASRKGVRHTSSASAFANPTFVSCLSHGSSMNERIVRLGSGALHAGDTWFYSLSPSGICGWDSNRLLRNASSRPVWRWKSRDERSGSELTDFAFVDARSWIALGNTRGELSIVKMDRVTSNLNSNSNGIVATWSPPSEEDRSPIVAINPLGPIDLLPSANPLIPPTGTLGNAPLLLYATQSRGVHAIDTRMRSDRHAFSLPLSPSLGPISAMDSSGSSYFAVVGTGRGFVSAWDLRFHVSFNTWQDPSASRIHRLLIHPTRNYDSSSSSSSFYSRSKSNSSGFGSNSISFSSNSSNFVPGALHSGMEGDDDEGAGGGGVEDDVDFVSPTSSSCLLLSAPPSVYVAAGEQCVSDVEISSGKTRMRVVGGATTSSSGSGSSSPSPSPPSSSSSSNQISISELSQSGSTTPWGISSLFSPTSGGHSIRAMASPLDGSFLLTGGTDAALRRWDCGVGERSRMLVGPNRGLVRYASSSTSPSGIVEIHECFDVNPSSSSSSSSNKDSSSKHHHSPSPGLLSSSPNSSSSLSIRDCVVDILCLDFPKQMIVYGMRDGNIKVLK